MALYSAVPHMLGNKVFKPGEASRKNEGRIIPCMAPYLPWMLYMHTWPIFLSSLKLISTHSITNQRFIPHPCISHDKSSISFFCLRWRGLGSSTFAALRLLEGCPMIIILILWSLTESQCAAIRNRTWTSYLF
jgi:hypothetical protein